MLNVFESSVGNPNATNNISTEVSLAVILSFGFLLLCLRTHTLKYLQFYKLPSLPHQALLDAFNNILNEANSEGWTQLQTSNVSGSQTLLRNAERYGKYLSSTVNGAAEPLMFVRESISENTHKNTHTVSITCKRNTQKLGPL